MRASDLWTLSVVRCSNIFFGSKQCNLPPPCAASDMLLLRNCDLLAAAADGKYVLLPFFFSAAPFVRFLRASFFFEEFQSPASAALFSLPSRSSIKYYVPVLLRAMNSQIFANQHSAPLSNVPFQKKPLTSFKRKSIQIFEGNISKEN